MSVVISMILSVFAFTRDVSSNPDSAKAINMAYGQFLSAFVREGMPMEQVERILGTSYPKGGTAVSGFTHYGHYGFTVHYEMDKSLTLKVKNIRKHNSLLRSLAGLLQDASP